MYLQYIANFTGLNFEGLNQAILRIISTVYPMTTVELEFIKNIK